jgi:hypothetical protein
MARRGVEYAAGECIAAGECGGSANSADNLAAIAVFTMAGQLDPSFSMRPLWALLTMARACYAAGRPAGGFPEIESFEEWSRTIGGIFAHADCRDFRGAGRESAWRERISSR